MGNLISDFKNPRIILAFLYDIVMSAIVFWISIAIRLETFNHQLNNNIGFIHFFYITMIIYAVTFISNGLYKGVWRFSSMHDLVRVVKASSIAVVISLVACFFMTRLIDVPRTMFIIQFFLLVVTLGGGRFIYRYLKDETSLKSVIGGQDTEIKNVLIVGAGRAGRSLLRDINATPALNLKIVAFVDDDKVKKNSLIQNIKVFGDTSLIPNLCKDLNVEKIFIAIPSASGEDVKKIVSYCNQTKAEIKILPKMNHLLSSQVAMSLLQNLKIEDLLGREQIQLDEEHLNSMITDKVIMVTGAGGSIGSELCMQIAKFNPKKIIMADYCELFMYELEMKFKENNPSITFYPKILDIRNSFKVEEAFKEFKPEIVFHAAAYKHVPMMEYNPLEAIETNVHGTKIVASMALKYEAAKFIMISTDKAVNPTNVMGASKRIAEMVITEISTRAKSEGKKTKFMSVRFGNVLGSNGSVIPLFRKQIEERKDITVTHPDIIRYFMSIPEACQLVLQAGSMGEGGEIFVLDMGAPVKIVDLAKEMIRLAGLQEGKDINITFSGLRPGEKLFEELFADSESYELTMHGKIRKANFRCNDEQFCSKLDELLLINISDAKFIVQKIKGLVPEFEHFRLK
jgi:FlaA1/EpsC-like NDP-sugar epimerase